jgi:hypothetical protein
MQEYRWIYICCPLELKIASVDEVRENHFVEVARKLKVYGSAQVPCHEVFIWFVLKLNVFS